MTEQASETTWATKTIGNGVFDPTEVLQPVAFSVTLSWNDVPFTTITVNPSPSRHLELLSNDKLQPSVTITEGQSARTVDKLILSLQTSPEQAILYTVDGVSQINPSTRSASSTLLRPTTTIKPPRSTRTSRPNPNRNRKSKPGIGSGAIAGIVIAGIVILAVIIGGWYFWRRKKRRTQPPTTTLTDDELARREGDGDKMVLDTDHNATRTGADQTEYQEMPVNGLTQELDRSHSYKYAIGGAHELKAEEQPGELPYNGMEGHGRANTTEVVGMDNGGDGRNAEMISVPGANNPTPQVSPHVEAQRKREVEWLEMEETRMRQRREALLQQGGGQHT